MTAEYSTDRLLAEDNKRLKIMFDDFDPILGLGVAPDNRVPLEISDFCYKIQYVPKPMLQEPIIKYIRRYKTIRSFLVKKMKVEPSPANYEVVTREVLKARVKYDFAFWCYVFIRIKDKLGNGMIPFRLNYPQRLVLAEIEKIRLRDEPIRIILLKARQWGGSTFVQIYMMWVQLVLRNSWYSTIIAQVKSTSERILAMYSKAIEEYPSWLIDLPSCKLHFAPYQGSQNDFVIAYGRGTAQQAARDTKITIGTYNNPNATRGDDTSLIHYSEVAIWNDTEGKKPEDIIRAVSGGLLSRPLTMEVMESTANGTGNYFHREWQRAKDGKSNRKAIFIPWFYIENDSKDLDNKREFAQWLLSVKDCQTPPQGYDDSGSYYWYLWECGATLEGINWYIDKRRSMIDHADMASEAPSDDIEAFKHSGQRVFNVYNIEKLRADCRKPAFIGEISGKGALNSPDCLNDLKFVESLGGELKIWDYPETCNISNRYLTVVDVGGTGHKSDYSVITVFDRSPLTFGGVEQVVAQWRGHIDYDFLAWKAAQLAKIFDNSLLVFESNTMETRDKDNNTDGEHTLYILSVIARSYNRLYLRKSTNEEDVNEREPRKIGFHTNVHTKQLIIDFLRTVVRDHLYKERDVDCCDEYAVYERKQNGAYGAINGFHDDMLMTRAIGLYISSCDMPLPKIMETDFVHRDMPINEASI